MRPLSRLPSKEAQTLHGLLFDLDDTLLDEGQLTERAYGSLFRLREAGLELVGVTGRPARWGRLLATQWPVAGVLTENGAIGYIRAGERIDTFDPVGASERTSRSNRLRALADHLRKEIPELKPTEDMPDRISDYTFDIGEYHQVDSETVARAQALALKAGARTVRSSVHLHISFDGSDKASGAVAFLRSRFGIDPTVARLRWAFIGDSENDAACFAGFKTTIGVANLRGRPSVPPRYVTSNARGAGFSEAAAHIIRVRRAG